MNEFQDSIVLVCVGRRVGDFLVWWHLLYTIPCSSYVRRL